MTLGASDIASLKCGRDTGSVETTAMGLGVALTKEYLMSNPWLKKNPFMSMWLSGANSVANTARGQIAAEVKRQSTAAVTKATSDMFGAWPGLTTPAKAKRKRNRFPGV